MTDSIPEEERDQIIDAAAEHIVKRHLEVPAILFLELYRPLTFLSSQALVVFGPILAFAFKPEKIERLAAMMEKRENLDLLLERIETLAKQRDGKVQQDVGSQEGS